jgi:hypothetical protein
MSSATQALGVLNERFRSVPGKFLVSDADNSDAVHLIFLRGHLYRVLNQPQED